MEEIEKFEVGEEVAVKSSGYYQSYHIYVIKRETATQYVIDDHLRFRKNDLRQVGDNYCRMYKINQELKGKIDYQNAKRKVTSLMDDIGQNRNCIETKSTENIEKAQELMKEALSLLGVKI